MRIVPVLLVFCTSQIVLADEFVIDKYQFDWTVQEFGQVKFEIIKTDESSYVRLYKDMGLSSSIRLSGEEAVAIAAALAQTRDQFDRQKGAEQDVSETVDAGVYDVTFRTSTKYGFSVSIRNRSGFGMDTFMLDRSEAVRLQPQLEKAPKMLEFIEEKINP